MGADALLFGFGFYGASEASRYQLFGNVWNGSTWTFFSSNEGPAVVSGRISQSAGTGIRLFLTSMAFQYGSSPFIGP